MNKVAKVILYAFSSVFGLFAVLFTIYFFNLDMKFMSKFVEPILLKHYDNMPRKQYV